MNLFILVYILFQDENNFINPLLQVGSNEKSDGSGSGGPKINGSDRIQIPDPHPCILSIIIIYRSVFSYC